jgi:uncharacterized membrane protein YhaH (DUF805 family)
MLSLDKPLTRGSFLAVGGALAALKVGLDFAVASAFGRPFSLSFYINPLDAPVLAPPSVAAGNPSPFGSPDAGAAAYWLIVVGVSLPFIVAGVSLTLRRLRDAGLPGFLAPIFFLPFAKFPFFAALAVVPSKGTAQPTIMDDAGPFRTAEIDLGPRPQPRSEARSRALGVVLGALAGAGVGALAMGVSLGLMKQYGPPLMMATPAVAGFFATLVYSRVHRPEVGGTVLVTALAFVLGMGFLALAAVEGFGCIAMAAPLFLVEATVGAFVAYAFAKSVPRVSYASMGSSFAVLPLAFVANQVSPAPAEVAAPIESEVIVHAPPDVVWKRVVSFAPLPPPTEAIFRFGIAAPLAATIDGEGVGAVRRCEFTTGTFVEPIEVWNPGKELSFSVTSQPDPMREWTLYPGPRPAHLDGYLESTRGQFLLEALADGSTRLIGRTWYRVHMTPVAYWRIWGDRIIHAIHLRVLRHVATLAEADVRRS